MKLFGGGGARTNNGAASNKRDEDAGLPLSMKILIAVTAILLALVMGVAAFIMVNIKAPTLKDSTDSLKKPTISQSNSQNTTTAADLGDRSDKQYTFLVCATDQDELHTDNIMLVKFDTGLREINVLNIPRDTMTSTNRSGASRKINASYMIGGIDATLRDVTDIIGFEPDFYLTLSFQSIADMVDAIGGITYTVPFRMYYTDPWQDLKIDFQPGEQELDGDEVVEFLRWRKNNKNYIKYQPSGYDGSDASRIKKQQEFLTYVAKEILNGANIGNAKSLAEAIFDNIDTDLSWGEILWLVKEAYGIDFTNDLHMMTLPGEAASSYAGTGTAYSFYFPDEAKTLEMINTYFNPYANPITNIDVISSPPEPYTAKKNQDTEEEDEDEPEEEDIESEESETEEESLENSEDTESSETEESSEGESSAEEEPSENDEPAEETESSDTQTQEPSEPSVEETDEAQDATVELEVPAATESSDAEPVPSEPETPPEPAETVIEVPDGTV